MSYLEGSWKYIGWKRNESMEMAVAQSKSFNDKS